MNNYSVPLPWQTQQWQQLYRCHQEGRLPHALLLVGQSGLGKALFAADFAKTLLCQQPIDTQGGFLTSAVNRSGLNGNADNASAKSIALACQHCRDCRLVAAGTHPDLCMLTTEQSRLGIKIDQIRDVIEKLNHTSQAAYKIIVINPADSLLLAASHALLKSLEEPSERTLFLLLTEKMERLLPTIRSRCPVIRFAPPEKALAIAWLAQQLPESTSVDKLYHLAAGAPLLALTYAQQNYYVFYTDLLTSLAHLLDQELDPIGCAARYLKIDVQQLLSTLLNVVSELLKCQLLQDYVSIENAIAPLAACLSRDFLLRYFDDLMALQAHTAKITLNLPLMLEDLFSRWALQGKSC
ncbi:MAG: AAA family ATPase [Candidatus Aquirickettsiella sp.]